MAQMAFPGRGRERRLERIQVIDALAV